MGTAEKRILVIGAGIVGAQIALHLAKAGARQVTLCDVGAVASGASGKALGGIRQQFSTAPEVRLARESVRFFEDLGTTYFQRVGYLFLATTEAGLTELTQRRELQASLGVAVDSVDRRAIASLAPGVAMDEVLGGVFGPADGLADPPAVTRLVVERAAALGVRVLEYTDPATVPADVRVVAAGARTPGLLAPLGVVLPVRPLVRQLLETTSLPDIAPGLPMTIEHETGFHFRRRGDRLVVAMGEPSQRWSFDEEVDGRLLPDVLRRLVRRYPAAAAARWSRSWAGLYDMTPDGHPFLGQVADGVFVACGFSGHGFMQSPAVGRVMAELILNGETSFDLTPFAPGRPFGTAEHAIL